MSDEQGKVVLVSGGAQGIGRCICMHLLEQGWQVCALDVDAEAGTELPGEVLFQQGDVAEEGDVVGAIEAVIAEWGRLDGVVSNAGIMANKPVESLELAEWDRVLGVNLTAAFLLAKHSAPRLRQAPEGGAIVNVASTRALQSEANTEAYAASKGGLVALTHALAASLGPAIRVNSISPGWIDVGAWQKAANRQEREWSEEDHRQHPAGRVGRPEDIAGMVAYLLSPQAGFMTGENIVIDGGMTRKMIYV